MKSFHGTKMECGCGWKWKQETNRERYHCLRAIFYQWLYPAVPVLNSRDFVRMFDANCNSTVVLVNIWTLSKCSVYMLEGAVCCFITRIWAKGAVASGYRSGMEAHWLQDWYVHLEGQISTLDGIVANTHAHANNNKEKKNNVPVKKWFESLFFIIVCPLGVKQKHLYYQISVSQEAQLRPVL